MIKCPICEKNWPALHGHHVVPREYGGESGPVVDICANCHGSLHSQAKHWIAGKDEECYFPPEIMHRAMPFIQLIMQSHFKFEETSLKKPPPKLLTIKLKDPTVLRKLHLLKADKGYSSLEAFMNALLENLVRHL